jgi:hypothetical protein
VRFGEPHVAADLDAAEAALLAPAAKGDDGLPQVGGGLVFGE